MAISKVVDGLGKAFSAQKLVFCNDGGVSFGISGSTITASAPYAEGGPGVASSLSFSDLNGISFGIAFVGTF